MVAIAAAAAVSVSRNAIFFNVQHVSTALLVIFSSINSNFDKCFVLFYCAYAMRVVKPAAIVWYDVAKHPPH